jgi:hypothetical protein
MHSNLRRLILSENIITDDGAVALAESFKTNTVLGMISLHKNYVSEQVCLFFTFCFENPSLRR